MTPSGHQWAMASNSRNIFLRLACMSRFVLLHKVFVFWRGLRQLIFQRVALNMSAHAYGLRIDAKLFQELTAEEAWCLEPAMASAFYEKSPTLRYTEKEPVFLVIGALTQSKVNSRNPYLSWSLMFDRGYPA